MSWEGIWGGKWEGIDGIFTDETMTISSGKLFQNRPTRPQAARYNAVGEY